MPRGIPAAKTQEVVQEVVAAPVQPKVKKPEGLEKRLTATGLNHVYYFDQTGDGRLREIALVKQDKNRDGTVRSIYYIDIMLLDNVDKGRLKSIITNRHSDKYELWDLLSQSTLSNGKNALDYFHQLTKVEHGAGAVNTGFGGGLASIAVQDNQVVGAEFSDPTSASLDTQASN